MRLRALRLWNVRKFANRGVALEDIGDGVNVLSAENEFGKSNTYQVLVVVCLVLFCWGPVSHFCFYLYLYTLSLIISILPLRLPEAMSPLVPDGGGPLWCWRPPHPQAPRMAPDSMGAIHDTCDIFIQVPLTSNATNTSK